MKKWLLRIGLGFLSLIALLLLVVIVRSLAPVTVRYQELQWPRANISEGSNAFDVLQAATSQIWWPDKQSEQIYDLLSSTNWDEAFASNILASNRATLASWDAAAKLPDFQVPEPTFDGLLYLSDWKKLAQVAEVRENFLFHSGQDKDAFDKIIDHVQLGRQMQNAHGALIDYLVGTAVCNMGLDQMRRWSGKTHLTPNQLKDYIRQLGLDSPAAETTAFANTMKAEYEWQMKMLDAMRQGKLKGEGYPRYWPVWPLFSFKQTQALFASGALVLVKAAPNHYSDNAAKMAEWQMRPGISSICLSGNPAGQIIYYMMRPALTSALAKKSQSDVQLQATRTILALRA